MTHGSICIQCQGEETILVPDPTTGEPIENPCPVCQAGAAVVAQAQAMTQEELEETFVPAAPDPRCKQCYGRGHIGQNRTTNKWRPCPKCYPGAAESELTPLEIREGTLQALRDPEKMEDLVKALAGVEDDGGEAADEVLGEVLQDAEVVDE